MMGFGSSQKLVTSSEVSGTRDAKFSKRSHPGERLAFTRVIYRSSLRRLFTNTTEVKPDDSTGERVSCVFYLYTGFTKERVRKRAPELFFHITTEHRGAPAGRFL